MTTARVRSTRWLAFATALATTIPVIAATTGTAAAAPRPSGAFTGTPIAVPAPDRSGTGITGWAAKAAPLTTPYTAAVSPTNALPEYPRPEMARAQWRNLDGVWEYAKGSAGDSPPLNQTLAERILVPYPVESALSGIKRNDDHMWYHRSFTVPTSWAVAQTGQRLLLHFGAVDFQTTIWVNGQQVGTHSGGYDAFTVDVTSALHRKNGKVAGEQDILVGVYDPTDGGGQPIGKQRNDPSGIFYTPSSGIWQTVWMEPAPRASITRLDMTPNLANDSLTLTVQAPAASSKLWIRATAYAGTKPVGTVLTHVGSTVSIPVPNAKLWTPDNPYLYKLGVQILDASRPKSKQVVDAVGSYFGMRSIALGKVAGKTRILLNGSFTYELGTLDQGFWPDGVYTAPTDAALKSDLQFEKSLGFNTVRKHIKIEPDRWYYDADQLGLLVWQDMPAMVTGQDPTPAAQNEFINEFHRIVDQHKSFTSIVAWVDENEGWGEFDPAGVANLVKGWDPSRLVDNMSGWNCCGYDGGNGDVIDNHTYVGPGSPTPTDARAAFDGEFGGLGLKVPGHDWSPNGFAYEMEPDSATLTSRYVDLTDALIPCEVQCGLSGSIYTQPTDVEDENNGLETYDRQVVKIDPTAVRTANLAVIAASSQVSNPPAPKPGTPGLTGVAYYPLDENAGGTTADATGNNGSATPENSPTWVAGHTGASALQFNGSNQFVDTNKSIIDTTGDYTVSAWVKLDSAGGAFATAVSQDSAVGHSEFFLQYSGADGKFAFSSVGSRALAATAPAVGVWTHLVGVRDSVHSQLLLYVNGVLSGTTGYCPGAAATGDTVIGRGQYSGNPVDFWRGSLDQVHIYDRALSADEISQLYSSNL